MSTVYLWDPEPPSDSAFDQPEETPGTDFSKIDNIEFEDVDMKDYPDFCNAFIVSADYDGVPMTEAEIDKLNENRGFVYEKLIDYLY